MMRMVQEFGAQAGRQIPVEKDVLRFGRAPDNDVVFDPNIDLDASGHHCEVVKAQGGWFVNDCTSRNGTWVNGVRVQRQRLSHGDLIECGKGGPRMRVELAGSDAPPAYTPSANPSSPPGAPAFPPPSAVPGPFGSPSAPATPAVAPRPSAAPAEGSHATVAMEGVPMGLPLGSSPSFVPPVGPPSGFPMGPPMGPPMGAPPFAPGAGASVGQAMTAGMPTGAHVGQRTMALMIDQALLQADKRRGSGTGLKVVVGLLTVMVLGSLGIGAYLLFDGSDHPGGTGSGQVPAGGDPSTAGARLATANEGNIYMLAVNSGQRDRGFCTAFAVTQDLLATNAHCVKAARREAAAGGRILVLRNKSPGVRIAVTELWLDPRFENAQFSSGGSGYDVGLARVQGVLPTTVHLAGNQELFALHEGDAIFVYGFPGMTMNETSPVATITLGLVNRLTDFFDQVAVGANQQKIQHSAQTSGGSSGSPIFLLSGSVVGINAGSLADVEHQSVFDPQTRQNHEVDVNRGSNFKYGMRADLIRAAVQTVGERTP